MATDYISREAAIEAIWKPEVRPNDLIFDALRRACEEEVKHIPAADVVEVVRCKDCKYYTEGKLLGPTKFCYFYQIGTGLNTADDDFCSKGERRV